MLIIRNGTLIGDIDADGAVSSVKKDILIKGDKIEAILKPGEKVDERMIEDQIDASDCYVTPGLIDMHVHLRDPGFEWKETIKTGSEAALLGGFTTICCMPNTDPRNDCAEVTTAIINKAKLAGAAKVLPIGAVSKGLLGKELSHLSELREAGCVAFSDDGEPIYNAGVMRRALEWCNMLAAPICCHEEEKTLATHGAMNESALALKLGIPGSPPIAEEVMIARDIEIARAVKGRVHICHVSTARGVELIRRAKNDGIAVTAEVTPHHLFLTESAVIGYNTNAKMNPPLRYEEDLFALMEGLKDRTIDCIASDHAPHDEDTKRTDFQNASFGIVGLQTNLPLMLKMVEEKGISLNRAIESFSTAPAKILNIPGGSLRNGAVADLLIIDPKQQWIYTADKIHSLSKNTPFIGQPMKGVARTVILNGKKMVEEAKLCSEINMQCKNGVKN